MIKHRPHFILSFIAVLGILSVIALFGIPAFRGGAQAANAGETQPSVLVSTIQLMPGTLPATVTAYGSIVPGPGAETVVMLQAAGVLSNIDVTPGQRIAKGEPLATVVPDPQSIADLQRATSAVEAARVSHAHVVELLKSHLATNADVAAADQTLRDAQAMLAAMRANGTGQARVIPAPLNGLVSAVLVAPGSLLPAGTALFRTIITSRLVASVGLPPAQAASLRPGDPATISLLNDNTVMHGTVTQISYVPDPQTGLLGATVALDPPTVINAPVKADVTTGTISGFVVPRDALQNDEVGDYAFQVDAKNIAHRVAVRILGTSGDQTVIAPDLNTAMPLVTTGAYQLADGMAVRTGAAGSGN
jgi:membrane fusion protein, multidrug efflux system